MDLRERLGIVFHSKLDILKNDRKFLGALFRYVGEPNHPLSVFGKGTQASARTASAFFEKPLRERKSQTSCANCCRGLCGCCIWEQLCFLFMTNPPEQQRTRKLVNGVLDLVTQLLKLTSTPLIRTFLQPFQGKLLGILKEAGWPVQS